MRFLQSLFLVVALAVCYLFFFRSQAASDPASQPTVVRTAKAETPFPAPQPQSQYKRDMDKAHAVANQMKESHKEADSF